MIGEAVGLRPVFAAAAALALLTAVGVTQLTAVHIRAAEAAAPQ